MPVAAPVESEEAPSVEPTNEEDDGTVHATTLDELLRAGGRRARTRAPRPVGPLRRATAPKPKASRSSHPLQTRGL